MLRKNHDLMFEKYEAFRVRNEVLEKAYTD